MIRLLTVALTLVFLSGCAGLNQKPPRLYWGAYSNTLYEYKKSPTPQALRYHKAELEGIIDTSKDYGILPPPGINAELGKIYILNGDKAKGIDLINQEATVYPESQQLMTLLLKKTN